jgi:ISXO2-like transposase domain
MAAPLEYNEGMIEAQHGRLRLIRWLMIEGFLRDGCHCDHCGVLMNLQRSSRAKLDGYAWRCTQEDCKARKSVREGSFFATSKLSLRKQMKTVISFVAQSSARSSGLRMAVGRHAVGQCNKKIMKAYRRALARDPIVFTNRFEYELDELRIKRVLQPNGLLQHQWVAGIVERQTGKCVYYRVASRSSLDLVSPAVIAIPDGSFTYTDEHRSYLVLDQLHYQHYSVNHSAGEYARWDDYHGVPIHVHINTIEGYNNLIRQKLKSHTKRTIRHIDLVLDEVMYRKSGRSLFDPIKARDF